MPKYSNREKRAFAAGKAFAAAKAGRRCSFKTNAERQSFSNGVKAVRGGKK
ncbi:MAG: hypothetical protein K2N22_05280 [Clostridia bacterium]|nr:hypothetical protein [Clostridia bacterium]